MFNKKETSIGFLQPEQRDTNVGHAYKARCNQCRTRQTTKKRRRSAFDRLSQLHLPRVHLVPHTAHTWTSSTNVYILLKLCLPTSSRVQYVRRTVHWRRARARGSGTQLIRRKNYSKINCRKPDYWLSPLMILYFLIFFFC